MSNLESIPDKVLVTPKVSELNTPTIEEFRHLASTKALSTSDDPLTQIGLQNFDLSGNTDSNVHYLAMAPDQPKGGTVLDTPPPLHLSRIPDRLPDVQSPGTPPQAADKPTEPKKNEKPQDRVTKTDVQVTRHLNKLPGGGELDRQDQYDHLKLPNGDTIMITSDKDSKGNPSYSYIIKERGKSSDIPRRESKDQFVVTMPDGSKVGVKTGRVVAIRKDNKQLDLKEQNSLD